MTHGLLQAQVRMMDAVLRQNIEALAKMQRAISSLMCDFTSAAISRVIPKPLNASTN